MLTFQALPVSWGKYHSSQFLGVSAWMMQLDLFVCESVQKKRQNCIQKVQIFEPKNQKFYSFLDKDWFEDSSCTRFSALDCVCSLLPICSLCSEACVEQPTVFTCMMSAFPVLVLETRYSPEAAISPLNSREVPPWFWSIPGLGKRSHFQNCSIASWLFCRV